ncbi:hypothetical protein [Stenotrophomonas sp. SY1]|uniref:radical SAM protein n=1 Tax=Stenotrophomonas sp. SY1 TaxID=477235 RepID=UPI001E58E57B|nr:hypothetical protein [Stenotrophomonas sp. SY1]MCD9087701.1 hypothetical protein [Stenotrophomonas sp. SY1]
MKETIRPSTVTVLCTYQCTAACQQCCFESSPRVKGALDSAFICSRLSEIKESFPSISIVVFTGGEALLLKDELLKSISHASSLGLKVRVVSNGFWAKRMDGALRTARALSESGLTELNISTGRDHQQFVPEESIINACIAAVEKGITTAVSIETDTEESDCLHSLRRDPRIEALLKRENFKIFNNFWMPFHTDAQRRQQSPDLDLLRKGCSQVFDNVVITPHGNISACCGLTLEHIPEMRLGKSNGTNIAELYLSQADDFMKYWLRVEGPYRIIETVMGDDAGKYVEDVVHGCQACAILHKTPEIRERLLENYEVHVASVMTRYALENATKGIEISKTKEMAREA